MSNEFRRVFLGILPIHFLTIFILFCISDKEVEKKTSDEKIDKPKAVVAIFPFPGANVSQEVAQSITDIIYNAVCDGKLFVCV